MRKTVPWFIMAGWAGVVGGYFLRGSVQPVVPQGAGPASAVPALSGAAAPEGGKIVHTFDDEATVQAFAAMWQQRHDGLLRLGLLEGYWNDEQAMLGQLNHQLSGQYGLDLADAAKSYLLDSDTRTLVERAETAATGDATASSPSAPEGQKVVHTFTDDEAMKAFAQLWQARQMIAGRMDVLSGYWVAERRRVEELNEQLATGYHVDVAKSYSFDQARRALVEYDTPPAPLPDALPQEKPAQSQSQ